MMIHDLITNGYGHMMICDYVYVYVYYIYIYMRLLSVHHQSKGVEYFLVFFLALGFGLFLALFPGAICLVLATLWN